jgi:AmmeMemoRadiSam system protein A
MDKKNQQISTANRKYLLDLARNTIISRSKKVLLTEKEISNLPDELKENRGCFVTLTINKQLRGCIGYILPISPLYQTVIENAYNAAYGDPRFSPVKKDEIEKLNIEISVLTIPEKVKYCDKNDLLCKINSLEDGIIIKKGFSGATFLPQVWEQLPNKEEFLNQLCLKAGLCFNEWENGSLDVEKYNVEAFEEE